MANAIRKPGEFCWINMITPQPEQASAFFAQLLGWTYGEIPNMGRLIKVGGHNVGGLFDLAGPYLAAGANPHIGVMVKVDNADAVCKRAVELGGKAEPPFDVMGNGRMGMCTDPNGARFDLWQPAREPGTDVDAKAYGAPTWFETITTDTARAARFYTGLFGWTTRAPVEGFEYTHFSLGGQEVGGMMPILPHMGKIPAHWGVYFAVKNADDTARETTRLGGQLCLPVSDIPGVGRFCGITSPQGVMFYAIQYKR